MTASITELNLKNFWSYLVFIPYAVRSKIQAYVSSGVHIKAVKSFARHANKSFTAHFEVDSTPSWEIALEQLRKNGREHYGKKS
jgi:hypothetical protein